MTDQETTNGVPAQVRRSYQRGVEKLKREGIAPTATAALEYHRPRLLRDIAVPLALHIAPETVLTRDDLKSRASAEGRFWYLEPADRGRLDSSVLAADVPPDALVADSRLDAQPPPSIESLQPFIDDRPFVAELRDGRIIGTEPVGVTADGEIVTDTITHTTEKNTRLTDATHEILTRNGVDVVVDAVVGDRRWTGSQRDVAEFETVSLLTNGWTNYYHWTVEHLPKIRAIERYRAETGRTPRLLVPSEPTDWMLELLDLVGVDRENCHPWTDERARAERLVVPSYPCPTPTTTRWVKDRVLDSISGTAAARRSWPSRVVISRRQADGRRLLNESAVMDVLGDMGFQAFVLEEMSVAAQAALFSNADVVVAPHGAGLTNIIYADDLQVVELFGNVRPTYYRLAAMLDFEYSYVLCEKRGPDIVANPADLRTALDHVS